MPSEKEKLIKEMLMINMSIGWWRDELDWVLKEMRLIENSMSFSPKTEERYRELEGRSEYLIRKGVFEKKEMEKFRKKCYKKLR